MRRVLSSCGHSSSSFHTSTSHRRKLQLADGEESDGLGGDGESDNEALKHQRSRVRGRLADVDWLWRG